MSGKESKADGILTRRGVYASMASIEEVTPADNTPHHSIIIRNTNMGSLWGSKNNDEEEHPLSRDAEPSFRQEAAPPHEADERTRLLQQNRDGYLSPDDPAVSPYNLWSVRFLRYFTVLFLAISFLWWVLLLVSIFVSPPGMHSRGSGFFDFSYTSLTVGNLLIVLLCFSTPSKAAQVACLVLSVLLLADTILIVSVPKLRLEEGWVGIASVVWALFISIWTVLTDRVVAWGKREEEERLTGRAEPRRTLREWCGVLTSTIVLIVLAIVVVLLSATLILRSRDSSLAAPGERYFVDAEKYQIHLFCEGNYTDSSGKKLPTVLFEAGEGPFEDGFMGVALSALKNGSISRYCYSDRPGIAWSDNAPSPFSASMASDVLSEALARAGEEGPWVLASAGVGSIYSRIFSARHGATQIKGLLLVDPLHEDLLYKLGTAHRGFALWLRGVFSPLGLDRNMGALFNGLTREDRVFGRSAYQGGKFIKAKLQESLVADSLTKNEVGSARSIQNRDVPLAVVSSGIETRKSDLWKSKQADLSTLTDNLVGWEVVNRAPHEVWRTLDGRDAIEAKLKDLVYGVW